jgi:hypothetical protein
MRLLLLGLVSSLALLAQGAGPVINVVVDPPGPTCGYPQNLQFNMANQKLWGCGTDAAWHWLNQGGGGGGGNVSTAGLTVGNMPKALTSTSLGNSNCSDSGTLITCLVPISANGLTSSGNNAGMTSWTANATPATPVANSWGFTAPAAITTPWYGEAPNAVPAANQIMLFPAPASNVSQWAWTTFSFSNLTDHTAAALGNSTATTQSAGDNSTKVATTAYTNTVYNLIQSSGSPYTMSAITGIYWNNSGGAYSFNLPTPAAGLQFCFGNYKAQSNAVSIIPGTGVTIYFKGAAGTAGSATGLVSGGAAGDFICLEGTDSTTYMAIGPGYGTWTNH